MNRPNSNAPPARRRITPIAVETTDQVVPAGFGTEQPLRVGPAPVTGSTKDKSVCGAGRRVWVDIQDTISIKFKDVLRQQGLEYATWRKDVEQRRAGLEGNLQGADAKRQGFTGRLYQRVQGLYEASDDGDTSDQNDTDEAGTGSDAAADGAAGDGENAVGSEGEDDEEEEEDDDDDDEKEGNETGAEIDLDKEEEEAEKAKKVKLKRQRFEKYDEDFIDDSELEMVKGAAKELKTKFTGYYAIEGDVELIEEPSKPRSKPKPRAPRADAAKADGITAAGAATAATNSKKRKQPDKQQQDKQPPAAGGAEAAAVSRLDAGRKKRQRSDKPGTAPAAAIADKPPIAKKVKPSSAAASEAAAAVPAAAAGGTSDAGTMQAPALAGHDGAAASVPPIPAGPGTALRAKQVVAATLAARRKHRQPEGIEAQGVLGAAAALAAAGPAPIKVVSANGNQAVNAAVTEAAGQQPPAGRQQSEGAFKPTASMPATAAETGDSAAVATSTTPIVAVAATHSVPIDGHNPDAAIEAAAAGLPAELVATVRSLQEKVIEHKPSGTSAQLSKPVKQAIRAVGITFLLLPPDQQQQFEDNLLQVLRPLMLPYGKDKKLRKELLEAPREQLDDIRLKMAVLQQHVEQMKQQQTAQAADAGTDDDDFQSAPWTPEAEQALVDAWKAAEAQPVGQPLQQLALVVFEMLGRCQQEPDKALEELRHIYNKAKKKHSKGKDKKEQQPGTLLQSGLQQQLSASSLDAAQSLPGSRQSPAPESLAAAAAAGGASDRSATPAPTPVKMDRSNSVGFAANLLSQAAAAAGPSASATGVAGYLLTQAKKESEKFSTWQAPSPRLHRCLEAAEAAGAPREWLEKNYPKPSSAMLSQIFRVLCMAGPGGCNVRGMVAKAAEHGLGFAWEESTAQRSNITQSLHTVSGREMVGVTESDSAAFALRGFPGVLQQQVRSAKQPKPPAAGAGDATTAAAEEALQQAVE